jgi:CheY-like chemotaxis protein
VLILTAADSVEQRVRGLDLGADDFMAKPFALSELEARVRALVRRSMGAASTIAVRCGPLTYDQVGRMAWLFDQPLELSAREIGVLEILLQRAGRLVSKEQIVDHLCEWGEEVSHNAIEVYMHRLRKKLERRRRAHRNRARTRLLPGAAGGVMDRSALRPRRDERRAAPPRSGDLPIRSALRDLLAHAREPGGGAPAIAASQGRAPAKPAASSSTGQQRHCSARSWTGCWRRCCCYGRCRSASRS